MFIASIVKYFGGVFKISIGIVLFFIMNVVSYALENTFEPIKCHPENYK